ncbi:WAS/WASL-interacting protein family member 2-like [Penaeus chinensis]|uniref:WAS/WASL-interacting protein family member 2-like n=1 Tax=Penaeus chinensis TaxID=139456 RepID=UPI001FB722CA|nr:WAS/WASL-interacting protein family member 2-like [Penaeus chinensis]
MPTKSRLRTSGRATGCAQGPPTEAAPPTPMPLPRCASPAPLPHDSRRNCGRAGVRDQGLRTSSREEIRRTWPGRNKPKNTFTSRRFKALHNTRSMPSLGPPTHSLQGGHPQSRQTHALQIASCTPDKTDPDLDQSQRTPRKTTHHGQSNIDVSLRRPPDLLKPPAPPPAADHRAARAATRRLSTEPPAPPPAAYPQSRPRRHPPLTTEPPGASDAASVPPQHSAAAAFAYQVPAAVPADCGTDDQIDKYRDRLSEMKTKAPVCGRGLAKDRFTASVMPGTFTRTTGSNRSLEKRRLRPVIPAARPPLTCPPPHMPSPSHALLPAPIRPFPRPANAAPSRAITQTVPKRRGGDHNWRRSRY